MRVEIFQFFIKRMSSVHAKRAADFREGSRQHNRGYAIYCRSVCDTIVHYLFTNNFVLMWNLWKCYSCYLYITKDTINARRVLDLVSFQISPLKWAPQCNFQPEFLNSFTVVQRQIGFVFQMFHSYHRL